MDFQALIGMYRVASLGRRLLVLAVLTAFYPAYQGWQEAAEVQTNLDTSIVKQESAQKKFDEAKSQASQLPNIEEKLSATEREMIEASRHLPDGFQIDRVLDKAAIIAEQVGLEMQSFIPGSEILGGENLRFMRQSIAIKVRGKYSQIATFFDHISHLNLMIHLQNMELQLDQEEVKKDTASTVRPSNGSQGATAAEQMSPSSGGKIGEIKPSLEQTQRETREKTKIIASADMIVFRTLTDEESKFQDEAQKANEAKKTDQVSPVKAQVGGAAADKM